MSARTDLHNLVQQFTDKKQSCCITLKTDIDHTPIDGASNYILLTGDDPIKALSLTVEQLDHVLAIGDKLLSLCFKKQKVLKFTTKEHVRTYVFEAYKDFLITVRNHGMGHYYQIYEITITIPK